MIKIIISGCNGKMGQVLSEQIFEFDDLKTVAGIDKNPKKVNNSYPVYEDIFDFNGDADIIIDFSNPNSISNLLKYGVSKNIPIVIATTGYSDNHITEIKNAANSIPIFFSANMSLGVNVIVNLAKKAAPILNGSFDIEIIEKHHNKKVDAPSGTAYMIANAINNELKNSKSYVFGREGKSELRSQNEIGIHAVRGGTIVGEHSIIFAGIDEVIEIKHTATSKKIFAAGSINAARFLIDKKPGLYTMDDLFK
ncbi:4-hydroxy-tetrahydrodipicolinate reductase [Brassicibacter mesophilus]|uniref:4-hydroxy-tetrahydrodipicolinate reductase n=1 Tax=Brassicibacter mesophilus TaxID=745119 RepID=UPI003D2539CE